MKKSMSKTIMFLIASCLTSIANAGTNQPCYQDLTKVMNQYLATQGRKEYLPGIVVSTGLLNSKNFPITSSIGKRGFSPNDQIMRNDQLFQIGSITKSFTSAILLQLVGEGKLSLDDKLGKWLPQYSNWQDVTIRELLNMTSGIPNYTEDNKFKKIAFPHNKREFTFDELISYAHPEKKIAKAPRKYEYSNSNYILAGKIIEVITKDSYKNQLYKRILIPFHLTHSYYISGPNWQAELNKIYPYMAHGYVKDDATNKIYDITSDNLSWGGPAGGIIANTQDTFKWVQLLYSGKVFGSNQATALKELESLIATNSGKAIAKTNDQSPEGFGLGVANLYAKKLDTHLWFYEGSTLGYRVAYIFDPSKNIIIIAALNSKAGEGMKNAEDQIGELLGKLYKASLINCYRTKLNLTQL